MAVEVEAGRLNIAKQTDDDGRARRTGNLITASAHIVTAVIGSGVLSLPWATAQLGWIGGVAALIIFSAITLFASFLLSDCYRYPGPVDGSRNYSYNVAVRAHLGEINYRLCAVAQFASLVLSSIGYIVTAAISMSGIHTINCRHNHDRGAPCRTSNTMYIFIFGAIEILLSQLPNFHELTFLSSLAAAMSFGYCFIGLGLTVAKIASGHHPRTTLTGATIGVDVTGAQKMWNTFTALGNVACAYTFSSVLIEIQDTIGSNEPENRVMKKASLIGISITTVLYTLCGLLGYAAFGNDAPGNLLTGSGFLEPYWLVDVANVCIIVHIIGAYQVFCQPVYAKVEDYCKEKWPEASLFNREYQILGVYRMNVFRLFWRSAYVAVSTVIAMLFPYFNSVMGLVGAVAFWPLTLYFPIKMHIAQRTIATWSATWMFFQLLSVVCLLVSILIAIASIEGLVVS